MKTNFILTESATLTWKYLLLGPFKENVTTVIRGEDILLQLRKIVCYISAEKTGSYKKTTEEGQILVLRTITIVFLILFFFCNLNELYCLFNDNAKI